MKRLQRYYYLVGIPVLLLFLGSAIFFDEIAGTVRSNPHPQINYVIFVLFVVGSALMLLHVRRINREGQLVQDLLEKLKQGNQPDVVANWLKQANGKGRYDVADLLHEVLGLQGRVVGPVEHDAIEAEIERFQAQQQRRLLLAQYFAGLMVGMGLFGTFIGLLGALKEIGHLIGGFAVGPGMADPVAAVSELVTRLTEPMKAMGVAFSASLFGVLGSMVMGMLMVFVKGGAAELVSLVHSRMSWLMDLSKATGGEGAGIDNVRPLQDALSELAQHSPLLKGLTVALDQSERRVRQLVETNTALAARLERTVQSQEQIGQLVQHQTQAHNNLHELAEQLHVMQRQGLDLQDRILIQHKDWSLQQTRQQEAMLQALTRDEPWSDAFALLAQAQSNQLQKLQAQWAQGLTDLVQQVQIERNQWQIQAQAAVTEQQQMAQSVLSVIERFEREQLKTSEQALQQQQQQAANQNWWADTQKQMATLIAQTHQQLHMDSQQRLELAERSRQTLAEMQVRQEQMLHAVLGRVNTDLGSNPV